MQSSEPLRERQRVQTWRAIHDAAAKLALEKGLVDATIEEITDLAGISRRTFFNYFATKEDAVLGLEPPEVPSEALVEYQAGSDDVLRDTVRLMTATVHSTSRLFEGMERRRQLVGRFPELLDRLDHHARVSEALIAPLLGDRLRTAHDNSPDISLSAKAMLMLAAAAMRFAHWHDPEVSTTGDDAGVDAAVEAFRDAVRAAL